MHYLLLTYIFVNDIDYSVYRCSICHLYDISLSGASVCSGDSGGGLYFQEAFSLSYYIRGVVSLAPRNPSGCDSNHYALYTKVSKYLQWIEKVTLRRLWRNNSMIVHIRTYDMCYISYCHPNIFIHNTYRQ